MTEQTTLVDMHAHYPMHLLPTEEQTTHAALKAWRAERLKARIVRIVSLFLNYQGRDDTPGVRVALMRKGRVSVAVSVLYPPAEEFIPPMEYHHKPNPASYARLQIQRQAVENHLADSPHAAVAHNRAELDQCLADGKIAFVHAVEGGLLVGADTTAIAEHVDELAGQGILYITLAHLFYRGVASNAPALPFLSDKMYKRIFHDPAQPGLTELGVAMISAMVPQRVLVDVTHMDDRAIDDSLALVAKLDAAAGHSEPTPLIASHMACRMGERNLGYNLSDDHIKAIAERGGVLGLIDCPHYLSDGKAKTSKNRADSLAMLKANIDRIHGLTGDYESIAIGTDLDGYIKPALAGYETEELMADLQDDLVDAYGFEVASKICSRNAMRMLRWRFP